MPAERRQRRKPGAPAAGAEGPAKYKPAPLEKRSKDGIPGVNKLKGQIRQTKRLLAKDTLDPAVRVAKQRQLTALEADLATAQRREIEKKNGAKYHGIKFFERKKLDRIIKRSSHKLEKASGSKKEKYATELEQARVMLNYILHFPNAQKYISLFPPSLKSEDEDAKTKLPGHLKQSLDDDLDKSAKHRLTLLLETRRLMDEGKLSATPEVAETRTAAIERVEIVPESGKKSVAKEAEVAEEGDDFFDEEDDE